MRTERAEGTFTTRGTDSPKVSVGILSRIFYCLAREPVARARDYRRPGARAGAEEGGRTLRTHGFMDRGSHSDAADTRPMERSE